MKTYPILNLVVLSTLLLAGGSELALAQPAPRILRGEPIRPLNAKVPVPLTNAPAPNAPTNAAALRSSTPPKDYALLGFDQLAGYTIEVSDDLLGPVTNNLAAITAKTDALIPATVRAFHRKKVSLKGFMLPLKVEGGLVTEMLIMKDQSMCCYGSTPKLNEWVSIKMAAKGVKALMDQPVTLYGTMSVGEMRENGYLTGIYSLDGERMDAVEE